MGAAGIYFGSTILIKCSCRLCNSPCCINKIINQYGPFPFKFTNNIHYFRYVGLGSAFIYNGQRRIQAVGKAPCRSNIADIRRNNNRALPFKTSFNKMLSQNRQSQQVIQRNIKKALYLRCVQIHGKHPISTCAGNQICHQFCRNGIPCLGLPVLSGVTVVWYNRSDTAGRGSLEGINHYQ